MKVADYVPLVMDAMSVNTRKGWKTYADVIVTLWGERQLDEVLTTDIQAAARNIQAQAVRRANSNMGTGAAEGFISCARAVWNRAVVDGLVANNPAKGAPKPTRRPPQARRALTMAELGQVQQVLASTDDPQLAIAVFRIFLETGARRSELLGLRVQDVSRTAQGPVLTLEVGTKRHSMRHQPITDELANQLLAMVKARTGDETASGQMPLLRNSRGTPITHRWLEYNAKKVREAVPELGSRTEVWFTWHLLRHTAAVLVERVGGFSAAQTFLGHANTGGSATAVTLAYARASTDELRQIHRHIWYPQPDAHNATPA